MVDVQMMINIVVIVLIGYVSIVLLSNIGGIADCATIGTQNSTLGDACNSFFNNSAVLFSIIGVVILLLVIPIIRGVIGGGGR